jgi:hypothetical protein
MITRLIVSGIMSISSGVVAVSTITKLNITSNIIAELIGLGVFVVTWVIFYFSLKELRVL